MAWNFASTLNISRFIAPAAALSLIVLAANADAKLARTGSASASFHATGSAGMTIDGTTSDVAITDDGTTVSVVVTMKTLTTGGMPLRDKHMKDKYLETDKYPTATLSVRRDALKVPVGGADSSGEAQGKMNLHGVARDVTFKYQAHPTGAVLDVTGTVHIKMTDYNIEAPGWMGIKVNPDLDASVHFQATDS